MAKVITTEGLVEESTLTHELWREDAGGAWTVVHQLRNAAGTVVRRDSWAIIKGEPVPAAGVKLGAF